MRRETTLTIKVTWDDLEVDRPGAWDWATLIDVERGHVEIVADSDDKRRIDILTENKL
jgi:hypothetical protein